MWVPFCVPCQERINFFQGTTWGVLGGGQKVYVEEVYVLFLSLKFGDPSLQKSCFVKFQENSVFPFLKKNKGLWGPARTSQGSLGSSGPEMPKSLEIVSWGLRPGTPKKSPKSSENIQKHSPDTFRRFSGDFPDCPRHFLETFSGPLAGGPGRHFQHLFGISGPEGPRDPCKGRAGSQKGLPKRDHDHF